MRLLSVDFQQLVTMCKKCKIVEKIKYIAARIKEHEQQPDWVEVWGLLLAEQLEKLGKLDS